MAAQGSVEPPPKAATPGVVLSFHPGPQVNLRTAPTRSAARDRDLRIIRILSSEKKPAREARRADDRRRPGRIRRLLNGRKPGFNAEVGTGVRRREAV